MASFRLGDIIVERLQFGYGAKSNGTPLYALTNLSDTSIEITADSTDITDAQGNLVYRKYSGKKGEVNGTNAFINLAVIETLSATSAEIATKDNGIVMPIITTVDAGKTLDITGYVEGSVVVNALSTKGSIGAEYTLGSAATTTQYAITTVEESGTAGEEGYVAASATLIPPIDSDEVQYIVKYKKTVYSGAKIVNSGDKFPASHELYFKALVVDPCDKENFKAAVIYIPSFIPSPEFTLNLSGGDNQNMDFNGAIMLDTCSTNKVLFELYFIDEDEEVA
jgi:hypothetical protein